MKKLCIIISAVALFAYPASAQEALAPVEGPSIHGLSILTPEDWGVIIGPGVAASGGLEAVSGAASTSVGVGFQLRNPESCAGNWGARENKCDSVMMDLSAHPWETTKTEERFALMSRRYGECWLSGRSGPHSSECGSSLKILAKYDPSALRQANLAFSDLVEGLPTQEERYDCYYSCDSDRIHSLANRAAFRQHEEFCARNPEHYTCKKATPPPPPPPPPPPDKEGHLSPLRQRVLELRETTVEELFATLIRLGLAPPASLDEILTQAVCAKRRERGEDTEGCPQ